MLIWKVVYDSVFRSFSGMEQYEVEHNGQTDLVMTENSKDSLGDVAEAIDVGLNGTTSRQYVIKKLVSAKYIGKTLND